MPSPFPGMDPYLEHPSRFPGLHQALITYSQEALNSALPAGYVADIGERVYVVQPERGVYPDLAVWKEGSRPGEAGPGGSVTAVVSDPPWVLTLLPVEMREVFLEIRPVADEGRIVTAIEVLSPSNKALGSKGRDLYLAKQRQVLESDTNLVEIDLLRAGEHTVAAPRDVLMSKGPWDYLVCLHRAAKPWDYEVWPILLRARLPRIRIPLADGDPDVTLDLQALFDRCYDAAGSARRVNYRADPPGALTPEDQAWVEQVLREHGLRE